MSQDGDPLQSARDAYAAREWIVARDGFEAVRDQAGLGPDDLYALANCAWWLGDLDAALPAQQEAYQLYLDAHQPGTAALVALDVGYTLALRGDHAPGSGWISRANRLLQAQPDGVEHGYLHYLDFEAALGSSDLDAAEEAARRIHDTGVRFGDPTLVALGVLGQGRVLVKRGAVHEGMALLDEAMVAATSDDLDPGWAGNIYCHLMVACHELVDLRRAGEWTQAIAAWCERMPGAGPFLGICRVHRSQLLQVRGAWEEAEREAARVCDELAHFDVEIVAEAHYQLGDLRRQRGDLAGAESEFRAAHGLGRDPQPGMALLRLARGQTDIAATSIRSALTAAEPDRFARARLLPAAVEIGLAADDLVGARTASDELAALAAEYGTSGFAAQAAHARGAVLLTTGEPDAALAPLRDALRTWQELGAPYDAARVRRLLAQAYAAIGDEVAAGLEREAARSELDRLGVVEAATGTTARGTRSDGLTQREAEVLGLVAAGRSNEQIAAELVLSIRTVERHLATIYQKLGVQGRSARAAAVSYALRKGLLARP